MAEQESQEHVVPLPAFELAVVGDAEYVPKDDSTERMARSRVTMTAGAASFNAYNGQGPHHFDLYRPHLMLYTPHDPPAIGTADRVTIREAVVHGVRTFTLEVPVLYTECYAFLASGAHTDCPPLHGAMVRLPLPATEPTEGDGDGE